MEITAELMAQILGLATVLLTGLFAWVRSKKIQSEEQGDVILDMAYALLSMVKVYVGKDPTKAGALKEIETMVEIIEDCWNDSKAGTPEMDACFVELQGLVEALLK